MSFVLVLSPVGSLRFLRIGSHRPCRSLGPAFGVTLRSSFCPVRVSPVPSVSSGPSVRSGSRVPCPMSHVTEGAKGPGPSYRPHLRAPRVPPRYPVLSGRPSGPDPKPGQDVRSGSDEPRPTLVLRSLGRPGVVLKGLVPEKTTSLRCRVVRRACGCDTPYTPYCCRSADTGSAPTL